MYNRVDTINRHYEGNNEMQELSYITGKPYTRWWWFSGEIKKEDIIYQLDWLKKKGFGGVEIAWVYPLHGSKTNLRWLSREWSNIVSFTKKCAIPSTLLLMLKEKI